MAYNIRITIRNRPGVADPEGETILNDLVLAGGYSSISAIGTAKVLSFTVNATDKDTARRTVEDACSRLRLYNPLVSEADIDCVP